jgi:glycosyltransferase involved in cell wall biosynthesis
MKIAMLIARFPPIMAGTEIQCYRLCCWLAQQGHHVTVLTQKHAPDLPAYERVEGFDVVRFPTWGGTFTSSLWYGLRTLYYLIRHDRFDVLHAHMIATPAMVASLASLILRTPVIVKITGARQAGDFNTSRRYALGRVKLWFFRRTNPYVACPSKETFEEARVFGIPSEKLSYIPNGIDTLEFPVPSESKHLLRQKLQWPTECLMAIYVGRWAEGKGIEKILDLWEMGALQSDFVWHLALVLSLPPPPEIADRIDILKERVHAAIAVADPLPYYKASDLAILLSDGEGMSNFLLEAMASGLPTLTTEAAAFPDAEGEKTGTYTLQNENALQEGLSFLVDISQRRERLLTLGLASQTYIKEKYTLDHVGKCYLSLYRHMKEAPLNGVK